jgi:hypothetical protein
MTPRAAFDAHLAAPASARYASIIPLTNDTSRQPARRSTVVEEKENHHGLIS